MNQWLDLSSFDKQCLKSRNKIESFKMESSLCKIYLRADWCGTWTLFPLFSTGTGTRSDLYSNVIASWRFSCWLRTPFPNLVNFFFGKGRHQLTKVFRRDHIHLWLWVFGPTTSRGRSRDRAPQGRSHRCHPASPRDLPDNTDDGRDRCGRVGHRERDRAAVIVATCHAREI